MTEGVTLENSICTICNETITFNWDGNVCGCNTQNGEIKIKTLNIIHHRDMTDILIDGGAVVTVSGMGALQTAIDTHLTSDIERIKVQIQFGHDVFLHADIFTSNKSRREIGQDINSVFELFNVSYED